MRSEMKLSERLAQCGWTPEAYVRMNPDLKKQVPLELLADHFLIHGLPEGRPYSDIRPPEYRAEQMSSSGGDFMVFGWSERQSDEIGVLLVKHTGGQVEWEYVDAVALWYWRDDVATHLHTPPKQRRHGVAIAGRATKFNVEGARLYVFVHGRFVAFSGIHDRFQTAGECRIQCFQLLESLHVHKELVFLLSKYPAFLEHVTQAHADEMAQVAVTPVYARPNPRALYAICAVVLGSPHMLKAWLMSLPDHHDLARCEVNVLCNGPESYDAILKTARWFGLVMGGHIRLLYSPVNLGFNHAVNHLVQSAAAEYVMVTNIDVQYLRFDLGRLAELCKGGDVICAARQFNGMGALQHLSLEIEVSQDMVHGEPFVSLESRLIGRNTYPAQDAKADEEVKFFGAACFFGKRSLLATLGPFSPKYLYAYHEDSDMALRARRLGVRLMVTTALDLVHFESSGSRVDLPKSFFIAANSVQLLSAMVPEPGAEPGWTSLPAPVNGKRSARSKGAVKQ